MVYNTPQELKADYPDIREEMDFDTECACIEALFDTYEHIGFRDTFFNYHVDKSYDLYDGKRFEVVRRLSYIAGEADVENLPMWKIKFENGVQIDAWPEEICKDVWPDHTVYTDVPLEFDIRNEDRNPNY